ncbi:phosphatidylserine decarboxylase [Pseudobutyrivibrio xylanivorans]|uniref:Phosphatidylserine decarboxylase n=1 Tax=Pseudobutyrivibrio xylanivorans TaxID=185007 RepID=A0A1G5RZX5_PSEXY|nr:phosphatidylserine decarboxylase [Pseudobutyrivibrio xylanivorans]SCZ78889.1 phosphatidylserine decarboxylase [Pseudobutyrivibrio xylanivorans]
MSGLQFLYNTKLGRIILRPLLLKPVSDFSGWLLDSKASKCIITGFAKSNGIKMEDYILDDINCFNDFFCRRIKPELRPLDMEEAHLMSPCDGLLKVYPISDDLVLPVKQSKFTISDLLKDKELAKEFDGGYCLVYRLCVNHYHRYAYFESGEKSQDVVIPGLYHTVQPVALEAGPVFVENSRQYTVLSTKNFGKCVQMEVGAMLVGRIVNNQPEAGPVTRGQEKGHFEYGGSTIIVLVPKGAANIDKKLLEASAVGEETPVVMGQTIGNIEFNQ